MTNTEKRIRTRYNLPDFYKIKNRMIGKIPDFNVFANAAELMKSEWEHRMPDAMLLYTDYRFWSSGEKVYEIHPNLVDRLMASNLKFVPTELVKVPFEVILIKIPKDRFHIVMGDKNYMVDEFIVMIEKSERSNDLALKIAALAQDGLHLRSVILAIDLNKSSIEACIEETHISEKKELINNSGFYKEIGSQEVGEKNINNVINFIIKCLLYITGADSDVEWSAEGEEATRIRISNCPNNRRKRIMQAHLDGARKTYKVGYKIILSREERTMYDNIKKGLWTLSYRFIVQGHFTHQACGPKHSERKVIFIKPYWKGPEYAEVINATHLVK
jgi:hypothetical protein